MRVSATFNLAGVLRRILGSRILRVGFVLLAIGWMAYYLIANWDQTREALSALSWWTIALALIAGVLAPGPAMLAWRSLLADLDTPLSLPAAIRVMFLGQLGKYLPGGIWQVIATVELGQDHAIPRKRTFTATVIGMAVTLASALALTALQLPFTSSKAARDYWWVLALVPVALICLHPRVLSGALNMVLKLARREPLERGVSMPGIGRALGWTVLGWILLSVQAWLLVAGIHGGGIADFPAASAAYLLAWVVGFLAIFSPGGLGTRELAMAAALAPLMDWPQALVVATLSRLISTIGDILWAVLAFALSKRAKTHQAEPVKASR